ncbi:MULTISPECIES: hypothetical protein [Legionella]|uniref:Methyltransferase domain-containing protein n=1 Tax=Legionella maceachernii TaxID=466 RepID=A0A0W0WIT9_9GAMM|nr:hypothetical protein [Legionella maceachernii]KTD31958.1 hypothetical protein Lmac_0002 [Legionella maceachernii]SKA23954.1 hypothetical protein SAMN02745128_02734 [Legionella maceachernii]SUP04220.1 Uncharacterised protein [Legionella maceachernii]
MMPKNLKIGLGIFLNPEFFESLPEGGRVNVLSIGCGHNLDVLQDEMETLIGSIPGKAVNYTGVDLSIPYAEVINKLVTQSIGNSQHQFRVLEADINNPELINSLQLPLFDLVLLRHPQFFEQYEESTKQILRIAIPALLRKDGLLIVSLYSKEEKIYMGEKEASLDAFLLKTIYSDLSYHENFRQNATRQSKVKSVIGFDDQCMYSLKNSVNTRMSPQSYFRLDRDIDTATRRYILSLVLKIGGQVVNPDKGVFLLCDEHATALQNRFNFTCNKINGRALDRSNVLPSLGATNRSLFAQSDSRAHRALMKAMDALKETPHKNAYQIIYATLQKKNYNQALRQAASEDNEFTAKVIELLLNKAQQLTICPTERNTKHRSALDYAEDCNHSKLSELKNWVSVHQLT